MQTLKVTGEKYRVYPTGVRNINASNGPDGYIPLHAAPFIDFDEIKQAAMEAFQIAGRLACHVTIDRVTFHEPIVPQGDMASVMALIREGATETVTGTYEVPFPHFTEPGLSRYNPVNGWCIPETITIE